jgi:glucose/arabinose dehydrogenase
MKFDSNGGLLVVEQGVGVSRLTFTDNGGTCLSVNSNTTVLADRELNHGLELSEDGRTLYVSTEEEVRSYSYDPDAVRVSSQQRLVSNMTNPSHGHVTRTLLLSRKEPGLLLVSRGSATNLDELAAQQSSGISQIRAYNISNATGTAYNYPTDGLLIGWGLRNSVGVAEHPLTGGIWSVENSGDEISRLGRDVHEDNPGEELNFHGFLNDSSLTLGANHGYPSCFALWNTTDFPSLGDLTVGSQFSLDNNATVNDTACAQRSVAPRLTFQAHMAPLDIKFQPSNASRAFISFHGSWNRDHPAGYKLSYVEFDPNTGEPAEPSDSVSAVKDVLTSPDLSACRPDGGCLRPAGLAFDSSGERLFVSSDATGELWVVMRTGEEEEGGATPTGTETRTRTGTGTGGAATSSTSTAAAALGARNRGIGGEGLLVVAVTVLMVAAGGLTFAR